MARLSFWQQLYLILWKNWNVAIYHWRHVIFCFFVPFIFALQLILLRCLVKTEQVAMTKYEPINFQYEWRTNNTILAYALIPEFFEIKSHNFIRTQIAIAYAPNTSDYVNSIMKKVNSEHLFEIPLISYTTASELKAAMMSEYYLFGVIFNITKKLKKESKKEEESIYPNNLSFSILLPREHRLALIADKYGTTWHTYELYDSIDEEKYRYPHSDEGGVQSYITEGFASLQNAISLAFISLKAPGADLPTILLHRFPRIGGTNDPLIQGLRHNVSFLLILGFLYPCLFITFSFNKEKEYNLLTFLHIMGISCTVQMTAWFITSFVVLLISSFFFLAALKIHWSDGFAILNNSSGLAVLVLIIAYILASISFTFMVSSCFMRRSNATLMLVLLWICTYIPSLIPALIDSTTIRLMLCIFSNCCMSIALDQTLKYESLGQGFLWSSYFDSQTINTQLPNGILTIFLILLSIIYTLIGLCIFHWRAGLFETPQKIRNTAIFQALRRLNQKGNNDNRSSTSVLRSTLNKSKMYEVNPVFKRIYVEIKGLKKMFKDKTVVKDINLELVSGEILVLMGRNGAGKSTLLSMITGMLKPTKGTVIIDDIDIQDYPEIAFENLGFCPQENILIPELNVFNQLCFHCRIKGLTNEFLEQEVEKYLFALNMHNNRNQNTGELSIGLKRYLSVCCALCAQSKFVVLDEPDTGMDLFVRRELRNLLLNEKIERTILMTTHSTEEADSIADRIAIMSGGELKCYGTSNFLRKIFGEDYRLICMKDEHCDSSIVTAAIQKFLPIRVVPETEIGTELSYRLDQKYSEVFSSILDYLERNFLELKITSISIGEASIDDVFLSICTENTFRSDSGSLTDTLNDVSSRFDDEKNFIFLQKTKNYKGFELLMSRWQALLFKRLLFNFRVRPILYLQFLVPIMFTAVSFLIGSKKDLKPVLPPMTFRLNQYPESVTVLDIREENLSDLEELIVYHYKEIIHSTGEGHKLIDTGDLSLSVFMLDYEDKNLRSSYDYSKYLFAATFSKNELKAWYNNYPLHTVPLSLNMMHNAILRAAINDSNAFITVTFEPLPYMTDLYDGMYNDASVGGIMAVCLTFCIGLIWSTSIMSLVKERDNNFKLIQYIHGARPCSYWLTVFFYDFTLIITISTCIIIVILCFQHYVFMVVELQIFYVFTLIVFGTLMLPLNYVISWLFDDYITAFCAMAISSIFGGVTFSTFMNVLDRQYTNLIKLADSIKWIMRIIPPFALCNTLAKLFSFEKLKILCSNNILRLYVNVLQGEKECSAKPYCCEQKIIWSWSDGLLPEIIAIVIVSVCSTIALVIIELRSVNKTGIFGSVIHEDSELAAIEDFRDWHDDYKSKDQSREKERIRVLTLEPRQYFEKALVMQSVGKIQKRKEVFHRIFLVVNHYECFGLFGSSISGKTAFMKMLVHNSASSYGKIYVNGLSLRKNLYKVYDEISYCQQISCNLDEFSGYELMKIYCMLHGIPHGEIAPICEGLARAFGFMPQLKKLIKSYSPGTQRRFRTSLAMLGNPSIIYLDEPMMGIDLASLRQLCYIICQVCKSGTALLFTSQNFNMIEIMCSRIGFLANGRLSHIGSPYELKKTHFRGYLVKLKLKKIPLNISGMQLGSTESLFLPNPFLKVQSFVETAFPSAIMKDQRGNIMHFFIPSKNMKLSHIFNELRRNSFILDIETLLVSQDTLSIFINDTIEKSRPPLNVYSQIQL